MVAKQEGKVLMAKVDIDDHTDLAIEYEVGAFAGSSKKVPPQGELCLLRSSVCGEGKPNLCRSLIPQVAH